VAYEELELVAASLADVFVDRHRWMVV